MKMSETIKELALALNKAQIKFKSAIKDSENPFHKSKFANIESIWESCKEALHENGLSVLQPTDLTDQGPVIETLLLHTSGEWIQGTYLLPVAPDMQKAGSALTYARRYTISAMLAIVTTDDDAESTMNRKKDESEKKQSKTPGEFIPKGPIVVVNPTHVIDEKRVIELSQYQFKTGARTNKTIKFIFDSDVANNYEYWQYCKKLPADKISPDQVLYLEYAKYKGINFKQENGNGKT